MMLTEDGKHLYVSYDEYHNLIEKLAIKVHQSGWQFDTILCLARGGMRPGDILSRVFDKPLAIMSTSSYRADAGTHQGVGWTWRTTSPRPRAKLPARCCWWMTWPTPVTHSTQ
jgi:hypoxanthine phosphoribosyltransferase